MERPLVDIRDLPVPLVMTEAERKDILDALKKDTRPLEVEESSISGASYPLCYLIYLWRGPDALAIGVDGLGFSVGEGDESHFANPSLAKTLEQIFQRNGVFDSEDPGYYKEILAFGAAGYSPGPWPPESCEPRISSKSTVRAIKTFVGGARDREIMIRIHEVHRLKISTGMRVKDSRAMIRSLVEDSWPGQPDEAFVDVPGGRDGLEISVYAKASTCVIWLDQSGFYFGKDGQYRFHNPSVARKWEKLFQEEGLLDSEEGAKYKRMFAAEAGRQRLDKAGP